MKTLKLIAMLVGAVALLTVSSCKKQEAPKTIEFTFQVTDVTAINAKLTIDATGTTPALVRYLAPVPETDVIAVTGSLDNVDKIRGFISENGSAINLPFSTLLKDLNTETKYVIGVVAFDENMDAFGHRVETFTTLDMSSLTDRAVGEPSGAGNLVENVL